nr:hypothetical protein [Tanacetum cinerariifolium]
IFGDNSSSPNNNSDEMGFTPEVSKIQKENGQGAEEFLSLVNAKVMNNSQEVYQEINRESVDPNVVKEGGSVLGVLEDMILSPVIHPPPQETSIEILHDQENIINSVQTFLRKFNRYSFFETPKVLLLAWDRVFEIKDALGTKEYKPKDIQELFRQLLNDVQNIHEELAEYINTPGWNRPAFYDDDDDDDDMDYTISIIPVLSTEEPIDSLSMGDEHLDTIPATGSDEVIKSSVENLVPIPSESEDIPEHKCDVPFHDNSSPLDISKDQIKDLSDSNEEFSSIDDDSFSIDNIDYVEASPPDSELVSSECPPTDRSDFANEEFTGELAHIISPPEYDRFYFWNLPDPGELISIFNSGIRENPSTTSVNLPIEDDNSPLLAYVVWIFLAYLTYPVIPPYLHPFENKDTISDPGITINHFYSFKPGLSHRSGTFKKFNTHHSHLNECLMIINGKNTPIWDVLLFHFYPLDQLKYLPDPGELMYVLNSEIRKNLPSTTSVN